MLESGPERAVTSQFLQAVRGELTGVGSPQMRLQTSRSRAGLGETNYPPSASTTTSTCRHCYTTVDLQRDNISLQNVSKSLTMNIQCHLCRRDSSKQEILFSKLEPHQETKARSEEVQSLEKSKKKKCKKDKNAGLNIPPVSTQYKAQTKTKTVSSQNKLKHLLATDNSSNKSCLQDFLKKL